MNSSSRSKSRSRSRSRSRVNLKTAAQLPVSPTLQLMSAVAPSPSSEAASIAACNHLLIVAAAGLSIADGLPNNVYVSCHSLRLEAPVLNTPAVIIPVKTSPCSEFPAKTLTTSQPGCCRRFRFLSSCTADTLASHATATAHRAHPTSNNITGFE